MQQATRAAGEGSLLYTRALVLHPGDHVPAHPALGGYDFQGVSGATVGETDFSGYAYTDGSCTRSWLPELRRAASALVVVSEAG